MDVNQHFQPPALFPLCGAVRAKELVLLLSQGLIYVSFFDMEYKGVGGGGFWDYLIV